MNNIIKEVSIDQKNLLSQSEKRPFINSITDFQDVFQNDLPGYNGHYGQVKASFKFSSPTRPHPQKVRTLGYGNHGEQLYNVKCWAMIQKGILIDPLKLGIEPSLVNNSWVIKKASASSKPLKEYAQIKDTLVCLDTCISA